MPVLRGKRVTLRPIEREDVPALTALMNDLETVHRLSDQPPLPRSVEERWSDFDADVEDRPGDSVWFVVAVGDEVIGTCGFSRLDHYHGRAELGIWLGRSWWGQGLGQDAMRTLLTFAFRNLNLHSVWLSALADDARALGAYRKVGFKDAGRLREHSWFDGAFHDDVLMEILRDDTESSP